MDELFIENELIALESDLEQNMRKKKDLFIDKSHDFLEKVKEWFSKFIAVIKKITKEIHDAAILKIKQHQINKKLELCKKALANNMVNPHASIKGKINIPTKNGTLSRNGTNNMKLILKIYKKYVDDMYLLIKKN